MKKRKSDVGREDSGVQREMKFQIGWWGEASLRGLHTNKKVTVNAIYLTLTCITWLHCFKNIHIAYNFLFQICVS